MKLARVLLLAMIALVVPLQGMSAVMAGQCMALGHHQGDAGHDSHGAAHDGHDHASHAHDAGAAPDEEESAAHCGPCTACCASASIAGHAALSLLSSPASTTYIAFQFPPLGVQPDGLFRPPLAL